MNIVTHNQAHALYPLNTFHKMRTLRLFQDEEADKLLARRYLDEGWVMVTEFDGFEWDRRNRRVGDSACWTISLENSPSATTPITLNSWWQFRDAYHRKMGRFSMFTFGHPKMKFVYTFATGEQANNAWLTLQVCLVSEHMSCTS